MANSGKNVLRSADVRGVNVAGMQKRFMLGGILLLPALPFLYAQGQYTRWKVGRLPDAAGPNKGSVGEGESFELLTIGESTVAGVGAESHRDALTGQFSKHLASKTGTEVSWTALGVSGITVSRATKELVPQIPDRKFDLVVIALGGNDVFQVNSPERFRKDLARLLSEVRSRTQDAEIFLANVPMVRDFIALPNPLRYILSRLAKLHHFNAIDLAGEMERVIYYDDVKRVKSDFFSDGIHPSKNGYDQWSESMVNFYLRSRNIESTSHEQSNPHKT